MIYIKKILNQDINKEMAFPPEPSNYFFRFPYNAIGAKRREMSFEYKPIDGNIKKENADSCKVVMREHADKNESKITSELKSHLIKVFGMEEDDLLVLEFNSKDNSKFTYDLIKKNSNLYSKYEFLLKEKENHYLIVNEDELSQCSNEVNDPNSSFIPYQELNYTAKTKKLEFPYNRIIFGAPGTGKSYQLFTDSKNKKGESIFGDIERVTFYPDYTYGQFVGSYKPISDDFGKIRYEYVPGPFMRLLIQALESGKHPQFTKNFLLIIEEINRANVASVFGDLFQLLDRDAKGQSMYEIQLSEDAKRYLAKQLGGVYENYKSIKIPNNMYIWATMNSADQGVFPMDTAFKRRWDFTYLGINKNEDKINITELPIKNGNKTSLLWNDFRKAINRHLLKTCKVNEDKLLGPFFISGLEFENAMENPEYFFNAFNSKVLMYIFEDAGKMHHKDLFGGIKDNLTFSNICDEFIARGTDIFGSSFSLAD